MRQFIEKVVIQKRFIGNEQDFYDASPRYQVIRKTKEDEIINVIPPFMIVHGNKDELAAFKDSKDFYNVLQDYRKKHNLPLENDIFVELKGGQ